MIPSEGNIHTQNKDGIFEMVIDRPLKLNGFTPRCIVS
jgi:1,4-dihydroxy-2-naphthoyl-CoA synthase